MEKRRAIYFPDLIKEYESEVGFIIEFERIINHIESFRKILIRLEPNNLSEEEEMIHWIEYDSCITMFLNFMASQLREAILFFERFQKTKIWGDWSRWVEKRSNSEKNAILGINLILREFHNEDGGFQKDILNSLRHVTFHYDSKKAQEWFDTKIEKYKDDLKAQREFVNFVDPKNPSFNLGKDYDGWLNSSHLIFSRNLGFETIFTNLLKIQKIQDSFLELKDSISKFLIGKYNEKYSV